MNLLAALGVLFVQRPAKLPAERNGRFGIRKGYIHRKSLLKKIGGEHESKTALGSENPHGLSFAAASLRERQARPTH